MRSFLSREQKVLLKFDKSNVIAFTDSESNGADIDEVIADNLSS